MPSSHESHRLISFNPVMLAAVQAYRKTVTRRRAVTTLEMQDKPDAYRFCGLEQDVAVLEKMLPASPRQVLRITCPFGQPGDQLRVLEAPSILLEVLAVRLEQLRSITEAEALAEGVIVTPGSSAVMAFRALIDAIYPTAWTRNEWVWVIEFRRL